jgi:hypothetical protein
MSNPVNKRAYFCEVCGANVAVFRKSCAEIDVSMTFLVKIQAEEHSGGVEYQL